MDNFQGDMGVYRVGKEIQCSGFLRRKIEKPNAE